MQGRKSLKSPKRVCALVGCAIVTAVMVISGCSVTTPRNTSYAGYINSALAVLDKNGLYRDSSEWRNELATARERAPDIDSWIAAYSLLRIAVASAGGVHSVFLTPADLAASQDATGETKLPWVETQDGTNVLHLPPLAAAEGTPDAISYSTAGREAILTNKAKAPCGWVIDLSSNSGGNGIAMLRAIAPLLDSPRAVGFLYPDGRREWAPQTEMNEGAVRPTAILISGMTRSAAELVLAAFDKQANTVRVGQPSAGMTTSNQIFPLDDGAEIVLSTAWFLNRQGDKLDGPFTPDIDVPRGDPQARLIAATDWVRESCSG